MSQALVGRHARSSDLEIQSRSCEYGKLFRFDGIRPQLLEPMPALDEANYMARFNAPAVIAAGPTLTVVRLLANILTSLRRRKYDFLGKHIKFVDPLVVLPSQLLRTAQRQPVQLALTERLGMPEPSA